MVFGDYPRQWREAVCTANTEQVKTLLQHSIGFANVDDVFTYHCNSSMASPLVWLLEEGERLSLKHERVLSTMKLLLDANANVEARFSDGAAPLHYATTSAMVHALVDAKADMEACDHWGDTPLFHHIRRAECGRRAVVETLLDRGACTTLEHATCGRLLLNIGCCSAEAHMKQQLARAVLCRQLCGALGVVLTRDTVNMVVAYILV